GESEGEGLWFNELIEFNVLGYWFKNRPIEEHERILKVLSLWGYENEHGQNPTPFSSSHKGILTPSLSIALNKYKSQCLLIDVVLFYAAFTFCLLTMYILTITVARINELLQISNTKECILIKKVKEKLHFSFKVITKGRDSIEEFYISNQTM